MKLYEITDEILQKISDAELETSEEEVTAELEKLEGEFRNKMEGCAAVIRNLTAEAKMLKEEADRLKRRASTATERADWLKRYVKRQMERLGRKEYRAGIFKIRLQKSQPRVEVIDENAVPSELKSIETIVKVDKKAIARMVMNTGELPEGVRIITGEHVRIY